MRADALMKKGMKRIVDPYDLVFAMRADALMKKGMKLQYFRRPRRSQCAPMP